VSKEKVMLCPQCQISLTVNQCLSVEINSCPQCHGAWLEQIVLQKIIEQVSLVDNSKQPLPTSQTTQNNENPEVKSSQKSPSRKRKHQHFLSGAFDISDDW